MLTILWDNDGVLVNTEGLYFRATQAVLAEVGVKLTPEQFKEISLKRGESTFLLAGERVFGDNYSFPSATIRIPFEEAAACTPSFAQLSAAKPAKEGVHAAGRRARPGSDVMTPRAVSPAWPRPLFLAGAEAHPASFVGDRRRR